MHTKLTIRCFVLLYFLGLGYSQLSAQKIKFTLQYNEENNTYEVYGKADFSDEKFFVGGGSQLSIVLPTDLIDYPFSIQSVAGGPWTDNSQIYAPSVDKTHDYHGIATNGSRMDFQPNQERLLFTFELPNSSAEKDIRLFDNQQDPNSNQPGMNGADFNNYFACALTVKNVYGGLYPEVIPETVPVLTAIEDVATRDFELFQNEPNPFKGTTSIEFTLPIAGQVNLTLRDITGRLLKEWVIAGQVGSNTFQIQGNDLPKGLLHYHLDTPYGSKHKKMILLE